MKDLARLALGDLSLDARPDYVMFTDLPTAAQRYIRMRTYKVCGSLEFFQYHLNIFDSSRSHTPNVIEVAAQQVTCTSHMT